jgi:hypothetical protein
MGADFLFSSSLRKSDLKIGRIAAGWTSRQGSWILFPGYILPAAVSSRATDGLTVRAKAENEGKKATHRMLRASLLTGSICELG